MNIILVIFSIIWTKHKQAVVSIMSSYIWQKSSKLVRQLPFSSKNKQNFIWHFTCICRHLRQYRNPHSNCVINKIIFTFFRVFILRHNNNNNKWKKIYIFSIYISLSLSVLLKRAYETFMWKEVPRKMYNM